ncbi:MAG TPA: SCO family protein [Solimonas sp.]|nr:SCO family protein [Solimonas sp.]
MNNPDLSIRRGRQQFLLLAALFFAPLLLAVVFYFFLPQLQPSGHTNYGQLVAPAQPAPDFRFVDAEGKPADRTVLRGHWSYVYLAARDCDTECQQKLYQMRQIRTLLNEKRPRVRRIYLAPDLAALQAAQALLKPTHPDLHFYALTGEGAAPAEFFKARDPQALYLTDPLANWLMVYPGDANSTGILKDIKKLLRLSQIG